MEIEQEIKLYMLNYTCIFIRHFEAEKKCRLQISCPIFLYRKEIIGEDREGGGGRGGGATMIILFLYSSPLYLFSSPLSLLFLEIKFDIETDIELSAHCLIIEWKCKWVMTRDPADT